MTTIVGRNGAGKSAVLRALRWVCLNRPQGDAFVRRGSDECQVTVWVDGQRVRRTRGADCNLYELDDSQYAAFGSQVPDSVVSLINLTERNFQGQHDAPFWFGLSPGQVSRELNQVFDLDLVDRSLSRVASVVRTAKAEVRVCEKRLAQAEVDCAALSWVEDASLRFQEVLETQEALEERRQDLVQLESLCAEIVRLKKETSAGVAFVGAFARMGGVVAQMEEATADLSALDSLVSRVRREEGELRCATELLHVAQTELEEIQSQGCPLCGLAPPA